MGRESQGRSARRRVLPALLLLVPCVVAIAAAAAQAAPPEELWTVCDSEDGAVQCRIPRGIDVDEENGHVFVADAANARILELNALGEFVKAWGWDVVESGPGEDPEDRFEICVPADGDKCNPAGVAGNGVGQFTTIVVGVALDSEGNVYVSDRGFLGSPNMRVQKFDPEGNFVVMFGGEVNKTKVEEGGKSEQEENLCPFDPGDECQGGAPGTGQGEFESAIGAFIGTDSAGSVYVGDFKRIQRFDAAGLYQDECAVTGTVGALAVSPGDGIYYWTNGKVIRRLDYGSCAIAQPFENPNTVTALAAAPDGDLYAFGSTGASNDPICRFTPGGEELQEPGECFGQGEFNGSTGMAANLCPGSEAPGNLFVSNTNAGGFVRAYGTFPLGCVRARTLPASEIGELGATLNGTVNPKGGTVEECFFEYGESTAYGQKAPCEEPAAGEIGSGSEPVAVRAAATGLAAAGFYHFRLVAVIDGENEKGLDEELKTLGPPVISEEHTRGTTTSEAVVRATVSAEGFATTCSFRYTTQAVFDEEGFTGAPATAPREVGEDGERAGHAVSETLEGLAPGTAYRWRLECANSSGAVLGEDRGLVTYLPFVPETGCANQALRSGASARLPDCRAYEMVSPVDKNGGNILLRNEGNVQSTPGGEKITYGAIPAFGDVQNSFAINQYIATRGIAGWSEHGIHPPLMGGSAVDLPGTFGLIPEFLAFTPDLCSAWVFDYFDPPHSGEAQAGRLNLERRDSCEPGEGEFEALVPDPPALPAPLSSAEVHYIDERSFGGASDDGRHAFFTAGIPLPHAKEPEAAPGTTDQVYERFCAHPESGICTAADPEGETRLVSVLPGGTPSLDPNEVGSGWEAGSLDGAVSKDGRRVYWTASGSKSEFGGGRIYLRERPSEGKPATIAVSKNLSTLESVEDALFWKGSPDGAKALYSEGDVGRAAADLYEFDLNEGGAPGQRLVFAGIDGVVGAAEDLSRIYFTVRPSEGSGDVAEGSATIGGVKATEGVFRAGQAIAGEGIAAGTTIKEVGVGTLVLSVPALAPGEDVALVAQKLPTGGQENDRGDIAEIDRPNLYLDEEGELSYVATLVAGDVGRLEPGASGLAYDLGALAPMRRNARVSPDGRRLVFISRARPTGYDNTDRENGKADVEVFSYEAGEGALDCVSCNPGGARPAGRELRKRHWELSGTGESQVFAAAWIPAWEKPLYGPKALSADGERILFNSNDALVPRDTNSTMDVYEWEAAGKGGCKETGPTYFPQNGGCLELISSGESPFEAEFWDAGEEGEDVFFITESSLVPPDPGLVDLYDARVNGGYAYPEPEVECEGETCQSPPAPPQFPTPASGAYQGPGNETPAADCRRKARRRAGKPRHKARQLARGAKRCKRHNRRAAR